MLVGDLHLILSMKKFDLLLEVNGWNETTQLLN